MRPGVNPISTHACESRGAWLLRAEHAVPRVPQTRHDVALLVQVLVDRCGVEGYLGMDFVKVRDTFARRHQTHELDRLRPGLLNAVHGGYSRISGRQHRVDDDDVPAL